MKKEKFHKVRSLQRVHNEISVLTKISHPNIVELIEFINSPKNIYLITDKG
jgi:serine/threonine protein kinase